MRSRKVKQKEVRGHFHIPGRSGSELTAGKWPCRTNCGRVNKRGMSVFENELLAG